MFYEPPLEQRHEGFVSVFAQTLQSGNAKEK
jgi:hypothetical protein